MQQLASEPDPAARDRILQEVYRLREKEAHYFQFILDISHSSAQTFQHILPNVLVMLSTIVLIRRDAQLKQVHQVRPILFPETFHRSGLKTFTGHTSVEPLFPLP